MSHFSEGQKRRVAENWRNQSYSPCCLTPAQLHSYEGKYRAKNDSDNTIQLIAHGNQLLIKQLWDGKTIEVRPLSDLYFYNKAQSYESI